MFRRRRAKDDHLGLRLFQTLAVIGVALPPRDAQLADGLFHPFGVLVTDADDLDLRMLAGHAQQVAHVEMIEVNAGDFPGFALHAARYSFPRRRNRDALLPEPRGK